MRREPNELPFTGRSWNAPAQRRAQVPEEDRFVTYHMGRAYLNESSIRDPDHSVQPADMCALREQHEGAGQDRQARKDANLAAALRLGEALKVLKGEAVDE